MFTRLPKKLNVVCPVYPVCDVGVLWPNGWVDQDASWYGGRPRPGRYCVRWLPSSPPDGKGHRSRPLTFGAMSIVAKLSPISATAELLLFYFNVVLRYMF